MLELTAAMRVYIYTVAAVLGLCMGSFLNCFAFRYARQESVIKGRSKCALCGHTLGALDLFPILSWVVLRGRCRYCSKKISAAYVVAELVCAIVYVAVLLRFDPLSDTLNTVKYLILMSLLFAAALADIYGGLIPDRLIITGAVFAVIFALFPEEGSLVSSLLWTIAGGFSVALPLLIVVLLFDKIMGRETMGGGDIKLMFLIGLYFHWTLNILILILACVIGIVFALIMRPSGEKHGEKGAFSFAPSLSLAAFLVMLRGDEILSWYLGFF